MDPVASHSCHLLQQLHEQRIQGLLCDCMLVVKGVCFKAHKNVLASFSQYFRTLFQNSSGQKNDVFHLDIKNVGGIGQILDFMYTSHLDLNPDNIQTMLDIAQCLQVQNVLTLCHAFLKSAAAAEPPPSLPGNSAFSLHGALAVEGGGVLGEDYPAHLLHECGSGGQPPRAGDGQPSHGPAPVHLHHSSGEGPKQTASGVVESNCTELPLKQSSYYYKLRNFYSKQFYKQTSCSNHERVMEQPFTFGAGTDLNSVENPDCAVSPSECVLESSEHLPSNFLAQTLSEAAPDPEPDSTSLQPAEQRRLKKAIHLKKLSFLKSQQVAQESPEAKAVRSLAKGTADSPLVSGSAVGKASGPDAEGKDVEEIISSQNFDCIAEIERTEGTISLRDQTQSLQLQRQYTCELCGKPFKHPSTLELHKRSHTGEKPFECSICGKHFSQAGNLQTHLRRHSGEKPYICEICGKRFAASGDVQRHIIIHSGEKPHLCDICGRGFSNFSNLKEHKKTHTSDKVFTCDECGKSFNMQRKLVKHRIRHTGERPYSCSACGKCFGESGDLRRHVRTHTGEKPYACEVCSKCFSRSAVLRRHKKMHCKATAESPPAAGPQAQASPASALDKSPSPVPLPKDGPVALGPASGKLPVGAGGNSSGEFGSGSSGSYCKLRSLIQQNEGPDQEKLGLDAAKLPRTQEPPPQPYAFPEEPLPADGVAMMRSSVVALDGHCGEALSSRPSPATNRGSEGPFFSSMTLWGLAMKTLQNESELDQ
ncbi:zinc finger and BTB domain-containing protein 49 isoform X1 [Sarcophilus harrisii]|uniref:Zinc finger and BTB domain-containing protein 49 n=2 Tax=Sarcophilus harrisii TaxID=9305 RepID=A0A7N4NRJ3_SARHA|nr:zinc finger and BTB domain-containing protein 49 isoform X1 [Sarcophilus harrisii]XP_031799223.1 zinc finger and BTB domain-containing protein 49 isoform X1 [Sarcophilus harrisii]